MEEKMSTSHSKTALSITPVIVIDSREQQPYYFDSGQVGSVTKALPAGDYSLDGFERQVAIERKSLSDFISTVVHDRERFEVELQILKSYEHAWVVIEGSMEDILFGNYRSKINSRALMGLITSFMADYIPIILASNRPCAKVLVEALLLRCHKRLIKKKQG